MSDYYANGWILPNQQYTIHPRFESQPPEDLRKSNFFNFRVELRTENALVDIVSAKFQHYLNEGQNGNSRLRNGIKYSVTVKYPNETTERKDLYLMLVDAATHEPIQYEGHDDNPKMKRVLLTHETICTRCSLNKSCGNKNEAPSDPGIASRGLLKFFLKCNQNCLKGAGNPRDMRRFALALSFEDITFDKSKILAVSNQIFVHNNSKHSRKRKREDGGGLDNRGMKVLHLVPSRDKITVVGENLLPCTRVFINNEAVLSNHRSDHVIEAGVPPMSSAPSFKVTLQQGEHFLDAGFFSNENASTSGQIACIYPLFGTADREVNFISTKWAVPGVTFMCADINLPIVGMVRNTVMKLRLPYNMPLGFQTITVLWNNRVQFSFPYIIQDRHKDFRFAEPDTYLCLYRKGFSSHEFDVDRHNVSIYVEEFDGKPFHRTSEWSNYFAAISFYESSRSYSSSSSEGIPHLSGSENSPPL